MGFPTVNQQSDPLKEYGWIFLVGMLLVGGWLAVGTPPGTGSDSVRVDPGEGAAASEQSLRSLDDSGAPAESQGMALGMPSSGKGSYEGMAAQAGLTGSLFRAPGDGAIEEAAVDSAASGTVDHFAKAMKKVADGGSSSAQGSGVAAPDHGWGGQSARSGLKKPKAAFGKVGSSLAGGGGSSSAYMKVTKAFGSGGETGLNPSEMGFGTLSKGSKVAAAGEGRSMGGLKKVDKVSLDSLRGKDEKAAQGGALTFDQSSARKGSVMDTLKAASAGTGVVGDTGVAANLKATDPKKINEKVFEPPPVGKAAEKASQQSIQEKLMMMAVATTVSGILGPTAGGVAMMIINQEMQQRNAEKMDRVQS